MQSIPLQLEVKRSEHDTVFATHPELSKGLAASLS
jgi:hypothetical protein